MITGVEPEFGAGSFDAMLVNGKSPPQEPNPQDKKQDETPEEEQHRKDHSFDSNFHIDP